MSNPDIVKEISVDDYLEILNDHCKRRDLEPLLTRILTSVIAVPVAAQEGATARTIAEAIVLKAQSFRDLRHREAAYEFVHMNFPDLVAKLYTPRVSTQEEVLVNSIAGDVSIKHSAVIESGIPGKPKTPSTRPTMIDLAGVEASAVPPRGDLHRMDTFHYVEDPRFLEKGGVYEIVEGEEEEGKKLAAKRAAEEAEEVARKKRLDEAAERIGRGKLDTLDPVENAVATVVAQTATVGTPEPSGEFLPGDLLIDEDEPQVAPAKAEPDLHGRNTVAVVSDATLRQAAEFARKKSAALSVVDSEEGVPDSGRPTVAPPEPK